MTKKAWTNERNVGGRTGCPDGRSGMRGLSVDCCVSCMWVDCVWTVGRNVRGLIFGCVFGVLVVLGGVGARFFGGGTTEFYFYYLLFLCLIQVDIRGTPE